MFNCHTRYITRFILVIQPKNQLPGRRWLRDIPVENLYEKITIFELF